MKIEQTLKEKKIWVQGLLIKCPFGEALKTCPAYELRKLPLMERLAEFKKMDESQLDDIIAHHRRCLYEREN